MTADFNGPDPIHMSLAMTDPAYLKAGDILRIGSVPFKVVRVRGHWVDYRPLTSFELWRLANPRALRIAFFGAWFISTACVLVFCAGCKYEQRPIEAGGNLECSYDGSNICGGRFHLSGSCVDLIDLNGTWKLCKSTEPAQVWCVLTSTTGN